MDVDAIHPELDAGAVEALVLDAAQSVAVKSICIYRIESLQIYMFSAPSGLLFRVKAKRQPSVLHFRVSQKIFHSSHVLCDPRLIVSPEKRCSVGNYELIAYEILKVRKIRLFHHHVRIKLYIAALVLQNPGFDVGAGHR